MSLAKRTMITGAPGALVKQTKEVRFYWKNDV